MKNRSSLAVIVSVCSVLLLEGCHTAPSRDIFGSYFPSWMLCAVAGIILAIVIRQVMVRTGVDEFVPKKALVYVSFGVSLTFITWLIWFGN